jgi:dTDP-4-dehydrorhamnose reductase
MSILVLGASGQLASHLRELLPAADFWGRGRLDLASPATVEPAIRAFGPSCIVNAAGYTAVDRAESERDAAFAVNAEAPAAMARAAALLGIPLVHVSTDYVFDGTKNGEYAVDDTCNPVSVYGESKLAGEHAVRRLAPQSWVLRTSWVFSEYGANFVKTILRLAREKEELRIVADQFGRPTYAGDLARLVAQIAQTAGAAARLPGGIYHAVGGAAVSWHEFAQAIVASAARQGRLARIPRVTAIPTAEFPTPAKRPANSVLTPSAELRASFDVTFDWASGLDRAIERLGSAS